MRLCLGIIVLIIVGCETAKGPTTDLQHAPRETEWKSLFDGSSLGNWASTPFGGEGEVRVEDGDPGAIVLPMGNSMTGVTWQGPDAPMRLDYEIEFEAMRTLGNDFFCALTFPVGEDPCTLVVAGWGGAVVGLSNLNGADASQNETTTFFGFKNDQWYHVRLRVEADRIQTWIDRRQVIDADITGDRLSIRPEVERSKPLGFASWNSEGWIRNIRWRPLVQAADDPRS